MDLAADTCHLQIQPASSHQQESLTNGELNLVPSRSDYPACHHRHYKVFPYQLPFHRTGQWVYYLSDYMFYHSPNSHEDLRRHPEKNDLNSLD